MNDKNTSMQRLTLSIRKEGKIGMYRNVMRVLNFPIPLIFGGVKTKRGCLSVNLKA